MDAATYDAEIGDAESLSITPDRPLWLTLLDELVIIILNVSLVGEVLLIFASTLVRSFTHSSALMGVAETAHPFLIAISFLGGAVSYSRGYFIVITVAVERMPPKLQSFCRALVEWIVILVSVLIGIYAIPLLMANLGEKTILLGISYAWLTVPISAGSALFVAHAGMRLSRLPVAAILQGAGALAVFVALFFLFKDQIGANPQALYITLAVMFITQLVISVPIGFVLATIGMVCVLSVGAADMVAVVMTAQRGSNGFVLLALPFFILAGFIMDRADIGGRVVDFVASLIGHVRGGLLQVLVVGCYLGSCVSGSKAADMAIIGIPMTKRLEQRGYPSHERAAVLAAAAGMAESVPPSIALILVGATTGISTGSLFVAGLLPAATLAICLMILVRLRAIKYGWAPTERAPVRQVFRSGGRAILPLLMPVILIGGIIGGFGTPTEVSTFAVIYGFGLGVFYRRFTPSTFWSTLTNASMLNGMIFFTVSAAAIASWAFTLEGITTALANFASDLGSGGFLVALVVITVIVAALLESFVTVIILAPLLLPVATHLGIDPLQYGIMMTESFGVGSILPPIGIALYVACKISGARVEKTTWVLLPYMAVLLVGLVIVGTFPQITQILPALFSMNQ